MKIFLIILGSYILLKLIMLIFPWGRWLARKYNDIYNLYRTYLYRGRAFLDSIKLFSKQLKRKKEKRKKKLSSILKTIVLNLISLIFSPLILIGEVLGYICEIIFCIISKKERNGYSAHERERNSNRKGYKKYELIKKEQEERLEDWLDKSFDKNITPYELQLPYVILSKDLPFRPNYDEVIYIDNTHYYPSIYKFIEENFDETNQIFEDNDFRFIFPPLNKPLSNEFIQYNFPFYNPEKSPIKQNIISCQEINQYVVGGNITNPGFLHFVPIKPDKDYYYNNKNEIPQPAGQNYYFSFYPLYEPRDFCGEVHMYLNIINKRRYDYNPKPKYCKIVFPTYDTEREFDEDAKKLAVEILERVKKLKLKGITETQLMELFEQNITLSHLHITSDFKIFLPDYNNIEIKLTPLQKSVFFLFLNHPEGIVFKELCNYREELLNIYKRLTSRVIDEKTQESIDALVDPSNNSINEKCARIREAFVKEFDLRYAKHYVVDGERGEPKKISLSRELVVWDSPLKL